MALEAMTRKNEGWSRGGPVWRLALARIVPDPDQPRKHFGDAELSRLVTSLRRRGVMVPVRVRWRDDLERWMLIWGECRWRAALAAKLTDLPAVPVEGALDRADVLEQQLAEQLFDKALNPIDEAAAFRDLMALRGWTQNKQLAEALDLDQSRVSRSLTLLELAPEVQALVASGQLAPHVALTLRRLPRDDQPALAAAAVAECLTAPELTDRVAAAWGDPERPRRAAPLCRRWPIGPSDVATLKLKSGATDSASLLTAAKVICRHLEQEIRSAAA